MGLVENLYGIVKIKRKILEMVLLMKYFFIFIILGEV